MAQPGMIWAPAADPAALSHRMGSKVAASNRPKKVRLVGSSRPAPANRGRACDNAVPEGTEAESAAPTAAAAAKAAAGTAARAAAAAGATATATAATTATTIFEAATEAAAAAATWTGTARTVRTRLSLVNLQSPALVILAIECRNCLRSFGIVRHFDETESPAATGVAIGHHSGALDTAELRKQLDHCVVIDPKAQIANVNALTHETSLQDPCQ